MTSVLAYSVKQILAARHSLEYDAPTVSTLKRQHVLHTHGGRLPDDCSIQEAIPVRLQRRLLAKIPAIPPLAVSANVSLLGPYLLLKRPMLRFVIYTLPGGRLLRSYLLSLLRMNQLSAGLILAGFSASLAALAFLEVANSLADVYFTQVSKSDVRSNAQHLPERSLDASGPIVIVCTQPVVVSSFSTEPRRTLLDGITSSDPYIKVSVLIRRKTSL